MGRVSEAVLGHATAVRRPVDDARGTSYDVVVLATERMTLRGSDGQGERPQRVAAAAVERGRTAVEPAVEQGQGAVGLAVADQAEQQRLLDDLALRGRAADAGQTGQHVGQEPGGRGPALLAGREQRVADA